MLKSVLRLEEKYRDRYQKYRTDIHEYPELSNEETETSRLVSDVLGSIGLDIRRIDGKTGVVGLLKSGRPGLTVGIRADMDALPIEEKSGVPFASRKKGIMHACGHDVHTAVLLGVAMVLSEMKQSIRGNVKFIFQPAEEDSPAGGAMPMIRSGVLQDPPVDYMLGFHVSPGLETGTWGINRRTVTAASDRIRIVVKGKSAHAAMPDAGMDAIVAAAEIIDALQTVVSRNVSPLDSAVVTIGKMRGGNRYNIIADSAEMEGTVRTVNPDTREMIGGRILKVVNGISDACGVTSELTCYKGYPPAVNDPKLVKAASESIMDAVGKERLIELSSPVLSGDDFAFYCEQVPSVFLWLGCRPSGIAAGEFPRLHSNAFIADENSLPVGVRSLAGLVLDLLGGKQ